MNAYTYYLLDVFTDVKFGGNQLAVFPDAKGLKTGQMQKIARELNLSETTFVLPPTNLENDFKVRIFTPENEMPTAGHPTIGTAYTLLNTLKYEPKSGEYLVFEELVGDITIRYNKTGDKYVDLTMNQPLPKFSPISKNSSLLVDILNITVYDFDDSLPIQAVSCGNNFLFVPLKNRHILEHLKVRPDLLDKYADILESTELYVFCRETVNDFAFSHGRMFAPMFGITEDSATGSASGPLGCYFVKHGISDGSQMVFEQGFEMGRPSLIFTTIKHDSDKIKEVLVGGNCVPVGEGKIYL